MANEQPSTPIIVEDDGWTLASGSQDRPTEEKLREALGADPLPEVEPPAEPEPEDPEQELPAAEEDEEPAPRESAAKRRKTHDPQRRIDKVTAELKTERETRQRLERELEASRQPPPAAPRAEATPAPAPEPALGPKPMWAGEEGFESQGKSWEEYEVAKEEWNQANLRQEMAKTIEERLTVERQRMATEGQTAAADAAYLARLDALRAKRPDYDTVIEQLGDLDSAALKHLIYYSPDGPSIGLHLAEHMDQAETLVNTKFTRPMVDAIRRSPAPVKVLEYMALHPEAIQRLHSPDPVEVIKEIGRIEARLDVDPSVTTRAARSVTSARPPLRTVSGGAPVSSTRAPAGTPAEDLPFGPDYIRQENQTEASRRQRLRGY